MCYGKDFWDEIGHPEIWNELLNYLESWKKEIPDMPSINFDADSKNTFEEIKNIEVSIFRKMLNNETICREILPIIFPKNIVLRLLYKYFKEKANNGNIYNTLANKIKEIIG